MASGGDDEPRGLWTYVNGQTVSQETRNEVDKLKDSIEETQKKAQDDVTQRNKERLRKRFADMKRDCIDKLDKMEVKALDQMDKMPRVEQEDLMSFWFGFQRFFKDFVGWIDRAWNKVLETIKKFWEATKTVVTGIYRGICKAFSFFNPSNW